MRSLLMTLTLTCLLTFAWGCESTNASQSPGEVYLDTIAQREAEREAELDAQRQAEREAAEREAAEQAAAEAEAERAEGSEVEAAGEPGEWQPLFDSESLDGWEVTQFGGQGDVNVEDGSIILGFSGDGLTGITWENEQALPRTNYEIALQAKRLEGNDFFCGLTFPVGEDYCSFIVGGWGGTVVGLSSVDYMDAVENDTTTIQTFEADRWYDIRVRVEPGRIQAWIDDEQVVDLDTTDRHIGIRQEVGPSRPLGVAAWQTEAAIRDIRMRTISSDGGEQ